MVITKINECGAIMEGPQAVPRKNYFVILLPAIIKDNHLLSVVSPT